MVLCCCMGIALSARQRSGDPPKPAVSVQKLTRQILEVGRLSPLNLEQAAVLLGSRLGAREQIHEYRSEWKLVPTAAIASGTAVVAGKDPWKPSGSRRRLRWVLLSRTWPPRCSIFPSM